MRAQSFISPWFEAVSEIRFEFSCARQANSELGPGVLLEQVGQTG
jgi:hypothetical protein